MWTIRHAAARRLAARCLEALFSLTLLVTLTFFLAHAAPGGPAYAILGAKVTPASAAEVSARLGVNVPVWQQYLLWWWHILHGNLGNSYVQARPVMAVIGEYAGQSAWLYLTGLGLVVLASLTAGLAHGVWYRGKAGTIFSYIETFLYAMPGFFIATLLAMVFATWLGLLPAGGVSNLRLAAPGAGDILRHLILPAASIMLFASPGLARMFAESVDQELAAAYVRTA
ncbi:MAG TPA: ABC transporter permease, partial [Acetobacteraceae bacterium]|nr:ABC transporter permease [Acetobacteraceae bacterium]